MGSNEAGTLTVFIAASPGVVQPWSGIVISTSFSRRYSQFQALPRLHHLSNCIKKAAPMLSSVRSSLQPAVETDRKTAAVLALQDGCRRLNLPTNTATDLWQFLCTKRVHDSFKGSSKKQLNMSPGAKVDKLWHFMLLNTAVSSQVHDLLGGVVEHRGIDHTDLPDDTKMLQRLYSMNVMRMEGHEPQLELWTEAGTVMHTVQLTTDPVPALQHLPGGGRLYVTPTLNQQLREQLVQALKLLYAGTADNNVQQAEAGRRRTRQQTNAASPAAAAADAATVAAAAPKRARRADNEAQQELSQLSVTPPQGREQQQQQQGDIINIIVKDHLASEVFFKVKRHTRLEKVMRAYCDKKSLEPAAVRFLFDGDCLSGYSTFENHDFEDGDQIDCIVIQKGC